MAVVGLLGGLLNGLLDRLFDDLSTLFPPCLLVRLDFDVHIDVLLQVALQRCNGFIEIPQIGNSSLL